MAMATFVLLLEYVRSMEEIDALIPAHIAFLEKHYASGVFLLSGRQEPRTGGVILARASSRDAIEAIAMDDPFAIAGAARYRVIEFLPTRAAQSLSFLTA
ncbi:uncharacterized protein YciI [Silvimonas terrae]|uniref:Uncharacterized protein YciI n=1 Tax=Silvimonas terrae TaxID=300266 RepID=A0A840RFL3_9NEIS|nr:YciI family protein [Silvimonas terrae]MBB5192349.1 uncharacterized protein YciI [Silvimonas terrae]